MLKRPRRTTILWELPLLSVGAENGRLGTLDTETRTFIGAGVRRFPTAGAFLHCRGLAMLTQTAKTVHEFGPSQEHVSYIWVLLNVDAVFMGSSGARTAGPPPAW